ncbi:3-hydroxybutyryl-CoA dehydratase [Thalassobacillus devorans]|uniref:Ethylmalonyl-CoA decarboxylase n=1 Tax=Thalassobacillus devorans TaxID=279813 RepID=A0ABQ1NM37_9BACI|nr:enoyl-CoA hydratase/isomerase family protein [Thalassobacillus devorans]NIK27798.1 enoyl-CoA hydratase/carnithine racemase [Thalassobacillus devorans]GGC80529.1 3-hydroxybutyryl-CoA dehydratase [Thalassobacillus devorans]
MSYETITYENFPSGLAKITLNRPDKMNAVSKQMTAELSEVLKQARDEEELKCLVITGSGDRAFCTGGDLQDLHGDLNAGEAFQVLYPMKEVLYQLASFPVPTVAVLNGQARGGGCEIATACDFRFAIQNASFGFVQGELGITPGWGGGALLYEKIRPEFAFQWLVEAEMYSSERVAEMGWAHRLIEREELENLEQLLSGFLDKSIEQMKVWKRQYDKKLSMIALSPVMDEEVRACAKLWESEEHKEAVNRFMNRRS